MMGWNSGKYYHGDLMERAMMLILGLTGNWGKHGTGARSWAVGLNDGMFTVLLKSQSGPEMTLATRAMHDAMMQSLMEADPTLTDEIANYDVERTMTEMIGFMTPPAFFWYYHCGYREIWNRPGYNDPTMKRSFDEYFHEALRQRLVEQRPTGTRPQAEPRFLIEVGGNLLRRQRGGARMLLEHLWPKLKMIVSVDWRINTTGLYADYILPAAQHYEKINQPYSSPMHMHVLLIEKAAEPPGEARSEWQMIQGIAKALRRARQSARRASRGCARTASRCRSTICGVGSPRAVTWRTTTSSSTRSSATAPSSAPSRPTRPWTACARRARCAPSAGATRP